MRALLLIAVLGLGACSVSDPTPSPFFDGRYVGTRVSNDAAICGTQTLKGNATAHVAQGHLTMSLFGPKTEMDGTVGDNGQVRASGIWRTATENYPQVTVLNGHIRDDVLDGSASNFRCETSFRLHKAAAADVRRSSSAADKRASTASRGRKRSKSHD